MLVLAVVGERGACYFFQAELPYDVQTYPYSGVSEAISYIGVLLSNVSCVLLQGTR